MLPHISHFERYKDFEFAITTDGLVGLSFGADFVDSEVDAISEFHRRYVQALRQIHPSIIVRFEIHSVDANELPDEFPRAKAINELGFVQNTLIIHLDFVPGFGGLFKRSGSHEAFEHLYDAVEVFKSFGIKLHPVKRVQHNHSIVQLGPRSIETDQESIGVVRIVRQPDREFSVLDLKAQLDKIPKPYRFVFSLQRIGEARAKVLLERKQKQLEGTKNTSSEIQRNATKKAMEENFKSGAQLYEIEMILSLARPSGITLSHDLKTSQATLSLFSEAQIETFGCLPSYAASLPGSRMHVPLLESENAVVGLMPIWGVTTKNLATVGSGLDSAKRSLTLLRSDRTLFNFDLFDKTFNAFNSLIVGPSGKGKSVLAGLLTSSLLGDENVHVIKIDAGGSHKKECELYGGEEFELKLDGISGLNPLNVISKHNVSSPDKVSVVSKFLSVLILELGENSLSKDIRSQIEESVRMYVESNPKSPSLSDFYKTAKSFPRRNLLSRWVKGGLYASAFSDSSDMKVGKSRLTYLNFSNIYQAADPEFAIAGFAALMAEVNSQVLEQDGRRIVLFLEEVPFFIKHCFELIKFTAANFRKFGHAVICVSQLLEHLIVNDDWGIIENSPQRFLFAVDGDTTRFKEILGLTDEQIERINSLQSIQGIKSEVALQTEEGVRRLTIEMSKREYWERTSSKLDRERLQSLMGAVEGLTLNQAIQVLSGK